MRMTFFSHWVQLRPKHHLKIGQFKVERCDRRPLHFDEMQPDTIRVYLHQPGSGNAKTFYFCHWGFQVRLFWVVERKPSYYSTTTLFFVH